MRSVESRLDNRAAAVEHLRQPERRPLNAFKVLNVGKRKYLPLPRLEAAWERFVITHPTQLAIAVRHHNVRVPHVGCIGGCAPSVHVLRLHLKPDFAHGLWHFDELPALAIPLRALHVERADYRRARVLVEDLEGRAAIGVCVGEEHVFGRPPRIDAAQNSPVRQHELSQELCVVLARLVRHVHRTATNGARGSVQRRVRVRRLEHVPVRRAHVREEERVVSNVK
mmetsp:Transcript_47004/g.102091  ORF Transcript_47004/g.102091 Transcript_47004/m.102091 type:complete len:225 (+) Transcript_47004:924-1598(+)